MAKIARDVEETILWEKFFWKSSDSQQIPRLNET
jgi:hypothetical protein